jgi:hypothetical protein
MADITLGKYMTKRYLIIKWNHLNPHEPIELYYELVDDQGASRSIEVFLDGSSIHNHYGPNEASIPALEEINHDPQLQGFEITEKEFEAVWLELASC